MGHDRRLAWLLGVDIATTAVGVVVLLARPRPRRRVRLLLGARGDGCRRRAGHGVRISTAARAGRADRVVAALAVANYLIALAATAIAPFAMPILLLATMLPAVLAVPYVSRRQLHGYVGGLVRRRPSASPPSVRCRMSPASATFCPGGSSQAS